MAPLSSSILIIGGPTASGKSALALAVARQFRAAGSRPIILNGDALQLYRDLRILSARPSAEEEADIEHRLYGTLDGRERGSVGRWLTAVRTEITDALSKGARPIVVGGTGMYLRALMDGLASIPPVPEDILNRTLSDYAALGGRAFRKELANVDPVAAAKLHETDPQRLVRALAVWRATGRPLTAWQGDPQDRPPPHWQFTTLIADPPRESLYARCDQRFDLMLEQGARAEVVALLERGLDPDLPVMKAVGVPEIAAWVRGDWSLEQARDKARQATRNYAKRQLTWFRNQMPSAPRLNTLDPRAVDAWRTGA